MTKEYTADDVVKAFATATTRYLGDTRSTPESSQALGLYTREALREVSPELEGDYSTLLKEALSNIMGDLIEELMGIVNEKN